MRVFGLTATFVLLTAGLLAAEKPAAHPSTVPPRDALWQPYRITPRTGPQHVALGGTWQLGWRDTAVDELAGLQAIDNWFPAHVPSSVQWALYRAGKFPHPYQGLNSKQYAWVDEKVWYYRRTFDLPAVDGKNFIFLCFDGIDYFARVWLNGKLLGRHEGMFGGPAIEIGSLAHRGGANDLVVEVKAGNWGHKADWKPRGPEGAVVKPWVIAGGTGGEMFFALGMWRGARVEIVPRGHLERPFLRTEEAGPHEARLSLDLEVFAGTHSLQLDAHPWKNKQLDAYRDSWTAQPSASRFSLRAALTDKAGGAMALDQTFPLETYAGRNFVKETLKVAQPKLWWPNGMGPPNLYHVRLSLLRNDVPEDALEFDYGIRTIRTVPSAGPRTADRWANWQFVVNDRPLFVKGINWMPADLLLDLPRERYDWLLGTAQGAGIQMLRIWGGGLLETEDFYAECNQRGLMVWQDFPIGNRDTPDWPQDVWEAQVLETIFRLRNHPALAVYCGGNEFNPYSLGNAATMGIWERCLAEFDPTRAMRRTSPDGGSIHTYPDMDPTWYGHLYRQVPFISETGMHSLPDAAALREVVDPSEFVKPLGGMFDKAFRPAHPDLLHHFVEYEPARVPRMLSRASHVADVTAPSLETLAEATQIAAGEFYQIFSEQVQANYPATTGLIPWVFKRPWPVIAIMLVDGFGQPTAPYYFLKRTYAPTHVLVKLPHLMWAQGEEVPMALYVTHAGPEPVAGLQASVEVFDAAFASKWKKTQAVSLKPGPSVTAANLGSFTIPESFTDTFFFVVAELRVADGGLVSRAVYWPRCLARMNDPTFRENYRQMPRPTLTLDKGPWLKPQTARQTTSLEVALVEQQPAGPDRCRLVVRLSNTGGKPAFNTHLDITGVKRCFWATDNFFWLAPGEERQLQVEVLWREPDKRRQARLALDAWNAPGVETAVFPTMVSTSAPPFSRP